MKDIDQEYTKEITCPNCGYEYGDSWEMPDFSDDETCPECECNFTFEREVEVTYSTTINK